MQGTILDAGNEQRTKQILSHETCLPAARDRQKYNVFQLAVSALQRMECCDRR